MRGVTITKTEKTYTEEHVSLSDDGEQVTVHEVSARSRTLHRLLSSVDASEREKTTADVLDVGSEVLIRFQHHGELDDLADAIENLDQEAKRIVTSTMQTVDKTMEKAVADLTVALSAETGPLMPILKKFDPTVDGNVVDVFRDLVASTATKATKAAVEQLAESTQDSMDRLANSLSLLEKVAAVEEARAAEARRGTAKGIDHERNTETLLGELVSVTGDSLDDVSTVPGLSGSKRGDKTITPQGGCTIVTEEKCTTRISESKMSLILDEAMTNRSAELALLIVDDQSKVPGNQPFHFIGDNKVVVVSEALPLRMVYCLFRAKSVEMAQSRYNSDETAVTECLLRIRAQVQDIQRSLERFRLLRTEHTKASKAITQAGRYVDETEQALVDSVTEITMTIGMLVGEMPQAA